MAITVKLGGIRLDEHRVSTVIPISMLMEFSISGMAFEPKEKVGENFDHLDDRVRELQPARGEIQRSFFVPAMKETRVIDPDTGEKRTVREPTGWSPTRKYVNATTDLLKFIQGPFLDRPPLRADLPAFVLYFPELLKGEQLAEFNAHMGGEFYVYEVDTSKKGMVGDGESRHLSIDLSLAPTSKLSGSRREKLKSTLVTVQIMHGIPVADMGQMYADFNGKGVQLTRNEVDGLDIRDPWTRAAKEVFGRLKVPLATSGRQVTAVAMAEHKHLLMSHAIQMVRGVGLGSYSKAASSSSYDEVLRDPKQFEKVVTASVQWFGIVLDAFSMPMIDPQTRSAAIFTDPDRVVRAMPIKVALGVMGNAWVTDDINRQREYRDSLDRINWRVRPTWNGIAGKVTPLKVRRKVDGKTVIEVRPDEFSLAAPGAKEVGGIAVRALTNPSSNAGRLVRGQKIGEADIDLAS